MKPALSASSRTLARIGCLLLATAGLAQAAEHMTPKAEPLPADSKVVHPWAGGVDPRPTLTSIGGTSEADKLLLKWTGFLGPYKVEQRTDAVSGTWTEVVPSTTDFSATVPFGAESGSAFFRVSGPRPVYLSGSTCVGCHPKSHHGWQDTAHAHALDTLKRIGQHNNPGCLPCHTVGYGLPGGFVNEASTPLLAGVQCENCHGPGGNHVADPGDLSVRPVVSLASMTCGGCHNDAHHPTYDEWRSSPHVAVNPELITGFMNTNVVAGEARMRACGACHSGAVRLAMLEGAEANPPVELPKMPSGDVAAHTGMTCAVCHTGHEKTEHGAQLRNPPYSMDFFSYSTGTNTNFTLQYKDDINLCGQCHNQRGARWQDTSRPPHHSPQYNVLVGQIGFEIPNARHSSHRDIAKQCTHCHTHGHEVEHPTDEEPNNTGHSFAPLPENCVPCHTAEQAEAFIGFLNRRAVAIALAVAAAA